MESTRTSQPLLEEYLIRLELVLAALDQVSISEVISSKDARLSAQTSQLAKLADDARRWQPPFGGDADLLTSVTVAGPGADIGPTLHLDGDAVRFVLSGSVWFRGKELGPGDWLLIPAGTGYRLRVGYRGVISLTAIYQPTEMAVQAVDFRAATLHSWVE
jgi:mannose-6-phosphate isomerase-like protein (cupin superfamily)